MDIFESILIKYMDSSECNLIIIYIKPEYSEQVFINFTMQVHLLTPLF